VIEPYEDGIDHLEDELERLDLLLRRELMVARPVEPGEGWRGLVISEEEVDALMAGDRLAEQSWRRRVVRRQAIEPLERRLDELAARIRARCRAAIDAGVELPLVRLREAFGLTEPEARVIVIALGPEIEPRYETLFAYLQDDVTRKRPSVNLVLDLLSASLREKIRARRLLAQSAPLRAHHLIRVEADAHDSAPPLLRQFVRLEPCVATFLLDQLPDPANGERLLDADQTGQALALDAKDRARIVGLAASLAETNDAGIVRIEGSESESVRAAAMAFAAAREKRLLLTDLASLVATPGSLPELLRDAQLTGAVPGVSWAADQPGAERVSDWHAFWAALPASPVPLLLLGPEEGAPPLPADPPVHRVAVGAPGFLHRRAIWESALNGSGRAPDVTRLADSFRFAGGRIRQTVDLASSHARLRDPERGSPTLDDLFAAGRTLSGRSLGRFAVRTSPRYDWSDIVLPTEKLDQLKRIARRVEFRRTVQADWGFGRKLSRGKGLNVLFTGPSGTGKTMAAEIVAGALSLDMLQIDLATVVSKYIGETEKNLRTIFTEAEECQSLLFFDEADALFGARTEVKDAHDRYANIEVNYLLQRIEQFNGIVVLATNLQDNVDKAFLRRIHEVVEFAIPDEGLRARIWEHHFPTEMPRARDIDCAFLGRQFVLSGGEIRNVVLSAAFEAASRGDAVSMLHLLHALKTEYQKKGKLCLKSDFGPYYAMLQREESDPVFPAAHTSP
jgi:hypothetical protein